MSKSDIPDYTGMLWLAFGVIMIVGLIAQIPVVGKPIAFAIVFLIIVGWIVSLFVKASRPRR